MTIADDIFEAIVALFSVGCVLFFAWWFRDIYRTNMALAAARARVREIGIAQQFISPKDASERFRTAVFQAMKGPGNERHIYTMLASLYLLRREIGLRCPFFREELAALPPEVLKQLLESDEGHIEKDDVRRLLPSFRSAMTDTITERLEENIRDLKNDVRPVLQQ